ncbi:cupin domain-containing protein [Mesorhizobium sp.]|uniref:cupin domain-containing protein n=1 Tax=Mesorhizobium sp. TaxID=1871066 RepID=UPI0025DC3DFE|nr:cupin domain-containing protein [Mesorhizobium sp.]
MTLPAILFLRAHPKQFYVAAPYSLPIAHARKGWLFPQGFCSLFVLFLTAAPVKECHQEVGFCVGNKRGDIRMNIVTHEDRPREMWRAEVETRMQIAAANGAAELCIFEQWVGPGAGAPTHSHPVEEVLTVIAGKAEMWIEDRRAGLTAGQSLIIPAHRKHGFRNVGSGTLHIHAVLASPIFEASFDGAAEPVKRWIS